MYHVILILIDKMLVFPFAHDRWKPRILMIPTVWSLVVPEIVIGLTIIDSMRYRK